MTEDAAGAKLGFVATEGTGPSKRLLKPTDPKEKGGVETGRRPDEETGTCGVFGVAGEENSAILLVLDPGAAVEASDGSG